MRPEVETNKPKSRSDTRFDVLLLLGLLVGFAILFFIIERFQ